MNANQLDSIVRSVLKIIGAFLMANGLSSEAAWLNTPDVIGAFIVLAGLVLSWRHHGNANPPGQLPLNLKALASAGLVAFSVTGCVSQGKKTVQTEPYKVPVGQTDNGTTIFPSGWYSVTNLAGQVMTYPIYSAVINTNPVPWSVKRFFWGGNPELFAFVDSPYEMHKGGGKALFVDSQYNQIQSEFQSGARFSGNSDLSVGNLQNTVSSNGIAAFGTAASQVISGLGTAISNAKK